MEALCDRMDERSRQAVFKTYNGDNNLDLIELFPIRLAVSTAIRWGMYTSQLF